MAHLLQVLVHDKKKRVLVCAPSNKAVSVIVDLYNKKRTTPWKENVIVSIGVQDKFDMCSQYKREETVNGIIIDERSTFISLWGVKDCRKRIHSDSMDIKLPPPISSQVQNEIDDDSLVSSALKDAIAKVVEPRSVADILVYTYSGNIADAMNLLRVAYVALGIFFITNVFNDSSCTMCFRNIITGSIKALSRQYDSVFDTMQNIIWQFMNSTVEIVDDILIPKRSVCGIKETLSREVELLSDELEIFWQSPDNEKDQPDVNCIHSLMNNISRSFDDLRKIFQNSNNSDQIAQEMLVSAQVVCCTLSTAGCGLMKRQKNTFDVLLVDEAGQCLEGEVLVPCCLNPKNLVLIGDPQQLPATIISVEVHKKKLGNSSMQRLMACVHTKGNNQNGYHLLSTQYRMHPDICSFPNSQFYQGRLKNADAVSTREPLFRNHWSEEWPVLFVNISCPENTGTLRSRSRYNTAEADMTATYVWNFIAYQTSCVVL